MTFFTTVVEVIQHVTGFEPMAASRELIEKTIDEQLAAMSEKYLKQTVVETYPSGKKREAIVQRVEWDASMGRVGDFSLYIEYLDETTFLPGGWHCWLGLDVLELKVTE